MEMIQFTIHTSNKGGGDAWNSQYSFNRRVENFDVEDLKMNLFVGQHLNFDHVISNGKLRRTGHTKISWIGVKTTTILTTTRLKAIRQTSRNAPLITGLF